MTGDVRLRPAEPGDADACARIVYEAFGGIHDRHSFQRDFPSLDAANEVVNAFIGHPSIWGVVAEDDAGILGSNFLDERGPIRGVGPITVDPNRQSAGVGRRLMEAVLERGGDARGVRLLQDSFNLASLSLYASLGFDVKEPTVVMSGRPAGDAPAGASVQPLAEEHLPACEELCLRVHGFERTNELRDALMIPTMSPFVALRDDRVVAYASTLTFFPAAYAVAETPQDMQALIAGGLAADERPASFLLPTRQAELFRWCLRSGLRAVKPMTYMVVGEYREPAGSWLPSVLY